MHKQRKRFTYANVMSTIAVFLAVGGATAFAAGQLGKNTVGSRQLKANSVTTGKIATNSVTGPKVAKETLTGEDIRLSALGTVPAAERASLSDNSNAVSGHSAACPANANLIRGMCFDSTSNPVANSLEEAADNCAAKGGWLPSPMDLYSVRGSLNLGTGAGNEHQYTNLIYADTETNTNYSTVVVDGSGALTQQLVSQPSRYFCVYPLVR